MSNYSLLILPSSWLSTKGWLMLCNKADESELKELKEPKAT